MKIDSCSKFHRAIIDTKILQCPTNCRYATFFISPLCIWFLTKRGCRRGWRLRNEKTTRSVNNFTIFRPSRCVLITKLITSDAKLSVKQDERVLSILQRLAEITRIFATQIFCCWFLDDVIVFEDFEKGNDMRRLKSYFIWSDCSTLANLKKNFLKDEIRMVLSVCGELLRENYWNSTIVNALKNIVT